MKRNHNIKADWGLIGRFLTGEATSAEREALKDWASASKINRRKLMESETLLHKTDQFYQLKKFNTHMAWEKTRQRVNLRTTSHKHFNTKKIGFIQTAYKYAAILIVTALLSALAYYISNRTFAPDYLQEVTTNGLEMVKEFQLPDGSLVTLNHNSTLRFPKIFDTDRREVILTGEAFFDVQSDPGRPFIIQAGHAEVNVLGTEFNIAAYPGEEMVEVVVKSGTVSVACPDQEAHEALSEVILQATERAVLLDSEKRLEKLPNTNPNYLAWKTRQLIFENSPLSDVIDQLSKAYHTTIITNDEQLNNLLLTARFDDKSIEFILDVIKLTFNIQVTEKEGAYIFSNVETLNK